MTEEGLHFIGRDSITAKPFGDYYLSPLTAACRQVVKSSSLLPAQWDSWMYLHSFHVFEEYRRTGLGTRLLNDLTDRTDHWYANLILQAKPYKGSSIQSRDLVEFYNRAGFETIIMPTRTHWMVRTG